MAGRVGFAVDSQHRQSSPVRPWHSDATGPCAGIAVERRRVGRPMPIAHFDAQIAATARCNGAAITTRNVTDLEGCGVKVINPWSGSSSHVLRGDLQQVGSGMVVTVAMNRVAFPAVPERR